MCALGIGSVAYAQDFSENYKSTVTEDSTTVEGYQTFMMFTALGASQDENVISVKVTNITGNSAKLEWTASKKISSYVIYRYNKSAEKFEKQFTTKKNSIKLTELKPRQAYEYMISSGDNKNDFASISFKTKALTPTLEVKDISSSKVVLAVSGVSNKSKVVVYRGTKKDKLYKIATLNGKRSYTDKEVKEKKTYYYKVISTTTYADGKTFVVKSNIVKVKTPESMGLPSVSGKTKTFAYYTAVTVKSSPQYKLLNSKECKTDKETGIRMVDGCYCIALGSYYGSKIGTKYKITLSSGESFMAILCDQKANRHTDSKHQYAVRNKDVVEFYVQKGKIPRSVRGDYGKLEQFKGSVVKIERY